MKLFSDDFPLCREEEEFGTDLTCTLRKPGVGAFTLTPDAVLVLGELSRKWESGELG